MPPSTRATLVAQLSRTIWYLALDRAPTRHDRAVFIRRCCVRACVRVAQVVGVAFQNLMGAQNIGFIIPSPIINHFLEDVRRHGPRFVGE